MPLVPFEHFMLANDRPGHPMSFFVRLTFDGQFDRNLLNAALKTAFALHPLLNSLLQGTAKDATSRIAWVAACHEPPQIDWHDLQTSIRFVGGPEIDLRSECGVRIWVREAAPTTRLFLQIHHCCCDGLGAVTFIDTLLRAYHLLYTTTSTAPLEKIFDIALLREREMPISSWQTLKMAWRERLRVARFFNERPVPLATRSIPSADNSGCEPFPPLQTFTFGAAETRQIQIAAKRQGVTVNALMLRDLFLAIDDWNRSISPDHRGRGIRVCMPVNLRRAHDYRMPAANVVTMAFMDRRPEELTDPECLLRHLYAETERTKDLRGSMPFASALKLLGLFPGGINRWSGRDMCHASTVMSNLGVPCARSPLLGPDRRLVAGGVVLKSIEVALPLFPFTHAAFLALNYGRELTLTVSHDPQWLDEADGREMLDRFVHRMKASLAGATPVSPRSCS